MVGHVAQATLEGLGKPVRGGSTDRDRLARIVEQGDLRRIIPIISSNRDAWLTATGDPTGQSAWRILVELVQH